MKRNNILFIWNVFECRWVIILFLHIHQWIILYAACEQAFAAFFRLSLDWWSSDDIAAITSVSLKYIHASIYRKICNSYFERCIWTFGRWIYTQSVPALFCLARHSVCVELHTPSKPSDLAFKKFIKF